MALLSHNTEAAAPPVAGGNAAMLGLDTNNTIASSENALSGISLALSNALENTQTLADPTSDLPLGGDVLDTPVFIEPQKPLVNYAVTAVCTADEYANVRTEPSEKSNTAGKFWSHAIGTVMGAEGDWLKIQSGTIEGYVKSEFVSVADPALIDSVLQYHAVVTADALKLRSEMSTESSTYSVARNGVALDILDDSTFENGWIKIKKDDQEAYVASPYVELKYEYNYAESRQEELERKTREAGSRGMEVANYGLQFVGNPYVWGGTSLTKGADCSGFVMSVYAHFGIGLPHSSAADRRVGVAVEPKVSAMQPGDLVCYSGHVALYIGNGQIVHAANRRSGIIVSNAFYRKVLAVRRVL